MKGILVTDNNNKSIPIGSRFSTALITLSGAGYNEITIAENVVEIVLKSGADFTIGEASDAVGFTTDEITLGTGRVNSIFIKGVDAQEIQLLKVEL